MKASSIKEMLRTRLGRLGLAVLFALSIAVTQGLARSNEPDKQESNQPRPANEYLGPTADTIKPYKPAGRDPFKKAIKPKPGTAKAKAARLLGFPPLDVRRAEFRQKADMAQARDLPEPDPVSQYLVSELDITGIFRDHRGFGAFVKAQPTGTMFFIRNGARCYNGEVMRIDGDDAESGGAKVMFRESSYLEVNGKQTTQERVVAKAPSVPTNK
ncbi:MAG TPA: hypothetical protein VNH22_14560 [Blastocatellia bacterium]|nr:hypothetical protein [Blastocatellia bacterium]